MRDTDLSDTDLDLLDKDIPTFCLSPIRLQDMSSRRLQDVFSVTIFRLPRRLQDVFARRLQGVLEDGKLLH